MLQRTGPHEAKRPPSCELPGVRTFGPDLATGPFGRCRSCAARARSLILNGISPRIDEADGFCLLTARAALFFTPHASLMQDVPCLHLSGLMATFAVKYGPKLVGPSALRAQCAISSTPCTLMTQTVRHRYTTDIRSESPFRAVYSLEHTGILRRSRPSVPPWPPRMLRAHSSLSLLVHLACSQHAVPSPSRPALHAPGLRPDRSLRVQTRPEKLRGLPVTPLRKFREPERR